MFFFSTGLIYSYTTIWGSQAYICTIYTSLNARICGNHSSTCRTHLKMMMMRYDSDFWTYEQTPSQCCWFAGVTAVMLRLRAWGEEFLGTSIFRFALFCLSPDCDLMSDENVKLLCDTFYLRVPSPGFDPVIFRLGSKYANRSAKLPRRWGEVLTPPAMVKRSGFFCTQRRTKYGGDDAVVEEVCRRRNSIRKMYTDQWSSDLFFSSIGHFL